MSAWYFVLWGTSLKLFILQVFRLKFSGLSVYPSLTSLVWFFFFLFFLSPTRQTNEQQKSSIVSNLSSLEMGKAGGSRFLFGFCLVFFFSPGQFSLPGLQQIIITLQLLSWEVVAPPCFRARAGNLAGVNFASRTWLLLFLWKMPKFGHVVKTWKSIQF